jgi:hypothetical protein
MIIGYLAGLCVVETRRTILTLIRSYDEINLIASRSPSP